MTPAKKAAKKATKKAAKKATNKAATKKAAAKKAPAKKSAASRKADKAKSAAKSTAKLTKAGLIDEAAMTDDHRKTIAKLKPDEVKALVSAKKKMGFTGKLHGPGADFF